MGEMILGGTTAKYGRPPVRRIQFIGGPFDGHERVCDYKIKCRQVYIPHIKKDGTITKVLYAGDILTPHKYRYQGKGE